MVDRLKNDIEEKRIDAEELVKALIKLPKEEKLIIYGMIKMSEIASENNKKLA